MDPQARVRLWVCEHYGILPTDDRSKKLTDLQAGLLFTNWLHSASDEDIKRSYWADLRSHENKGPCREDLAAIGYTESQIDEILQEAST